MKDDVDGVVNALLAHTITPGQAEARTKEDEPEEEAVPASVPANDGTQSIETQAFNAAKRGDLDAVKRIVESQKANPRLIINMVIMGGSECPIAKKKGEICQWALEEGACLLFSFSSKTQSTVKGAMKPGNCKMLGGPGERAKGSNRSVE